MKHNLWAGEEMETSNNSDLDYRGSRSTYAESDVEMDN